MKDYRILMVEYLESDINLAKREIGKVLEKFQISIVETREDFVDQLDKFYPDLIITNYKLPAFDALTVLNLAMEKAPLTPVIVLTASINEDTAVVCLKAGAADYFTKEHIKKFGKTVLNTLSENEKKREKVSMEETLVSNLERYQSMFADNKQPMYVFDLDTLSFLEVNTAAEEHYGYTKDEFLSMTLLDVSPVEDIPSIIKDAKAQPGYHTSGNWWHLKKNGEIMHVEIATHSIDYNGRKACYMQVADVTERKKAWQTLTASEEKYRTLFENVQDVFFQTDLEGAIYEVSPSVDRYLGFSRDELIGSPVTELYYDINERDTLLKLLKENGKVWDYTIRFKARYDEIIHVSMNARLIYNKVGKPDLIEGSFRDITARVAAQEILHRSEEKYRTLFEKKSSVSLIINPETHLIVDANHAATRFYGYSKEKLMKMKMSEITADKPEDLSLLFEKIKIQGYMQFETLHFCKDSSLKDVEVFATKIAISGNDYISLIVYDIAARKLVEQQNNILIQSIDQCPVGILITDYDGRIEYVNPKFSSVTGYNLEGIKGKNQWFLYSGKNSGESYTEMWETVLSGKDWTGEYPVKRKNGEQYWQSVSVSPLMNGKDQFSHVVAFCEDITERHNQWEELIAAKEKVDASDKLKSVLINNISNEVRTPLNGIVGFTEMLVNTEFSNENKQNFISIIRESSTCLLNTINNYMDTSMILSGETKVYTRQFHLNTLLDEVRDEFLGTCKSKGLVLNVQQPKKPIDIQLNTDQDIVNKILIHLLSNAVKYTEKGIIEFGFRKRNDIPEFFVTDSGTGIESKKVKTISEFYKQHSSNSTRSYENSALGLPIARGLVELLGGEIFVQNEKKGGTTFYFTLPDTVLVTTVSKEEVTTKHPLLTTNPVILVAEDDDFNYKFIETVLNKADFKVIRAENGVEAVNICYNNPNVSLVLMDLKMPVMGGIEATRQIKNFLPDLPVIALTAFVSSQNEQEAFLSGCEEYIKKPVDRAHLMASVGHVLGAKVN